jgi:cell division protease FtsH
MAMGGRIAEELVTGDFSNGAYGDIKQATRIARAMVCEFGMSNELGPQSFGEREEMLFLGREVSRHQDYSEATALRIDAEVNRLLREAYDEALRILRENRDKLDLLTKFLLERETLDGRDVVDIIRHGRILAEADRPADGGDAAGSSAPGPAAAAPAPATPPAPLVGGPSPDPQPA